MGELAQLITALAALVTSLGGATAAIIIAMRSGRRQGAKVRREEARSGPATQPDGDDGLSLEDAQALADLIEKINPRGDG